MSSKWTYRHHEFNQKLNEYVFGGPWPDQLIWTVLLLALLFKYRQVIASWFQYGEQPVKCRCEPQNGSLKKEKYLELPVLPQPTLKVSGSNLIQCYAPASGRDLGRVQPLTRDGIDRAIAKAYEAQAVWASYPWKARRKLLRTLLRHILDDQESIAHIACVDSGKTRVDASFGEILVTCEKLKWTIKHAEEALATEQRPANLLMCYKRNEVRYEPLGVVAALVSWNYPFHNVLHPIISAIATGNGLILKPSERTCLSAVHFVSMVQRAISACFPDQPSLPNLIACAPCWPAEAEHLTSHPHIRHITFIGSKEVGHKVAMSAAKSLTPVTMELGGKDPAVILKDTPKSDLSRIALILMRGTFQAAGQNCIGIERVIVESEEHLRMLLTDLEKRVQALKVGDPLVPEQADEVQVGACITDERFSELEQLVLDATRKGAVLHCGGRRVVVEGSKGHFFAPTLLSNVSPSMKIAQTELFAPVMLVFSAESLKAARQPVAIANGTSYALGSSVFGRHGSQALQAAQAQVRAGMVSTNDFASFYLCSLPFGGAPGSGYGRFGGPEGLRALCNVKSVNEDRFGGIVKTSIPPRLDYSTEGDGVEKKKWLFASGLNKLGFGESIMDRLAGLAQVVGNS